MKPRSVLHLISSCITIHAMKFLSLTVLGLLWFAPVGLAAAGAQAKLSNAALRQFGARVSVIPGTGVRKDPQTEPEGTFDGNVHSRQVMSGTPYTFTIELPFRLLVERLAFTDSDYESEVAPKDLEVVLDDGTKLQHTLELQRPVKRKPVWQELPIGKEVKTIKITVLSNHIVSEKVNWGGLGEIAVLTAANLEERFRITGHDSKAATFVHLSPMTSSVPSRVHLPTSAKPGEHPCLLMTRTELIELRATLRQTERGKAALAVLTNVADGALSGAVNFPDPKGPLGQIKSRGDDVARQHSTLSEQAGTLGIAYALTGDQKYARRAAEIVLGYAARYAAYPEHKGVNKSDTGKVMGQRLSEAMWLIPLIESYDYICESGLLNAAERKSIEGELIRPAIAFIWRKEPSAEVAERDRRNPGWRTASPAPGTGKAVGNWLNYYNTATMMAGAVMGDTNLLDLAAANFRVLLAQGIGADGMWGEGAIGYQLFALTAMVPGFEVAARQGIDLWSFDHCRVKMLFDSPLRYAYPDGTAPGINDSGRARFDNWSTMIYDLAWLRYQDLNHASLVNSSPRQLQMSQGVYFPTRVYENLPEPPASRYPSTVFGNLGYAILRNTNVYALLDYGPHGGVHGHYDKLNLVLFATGDGGKADELGGEPVFHRYEDPLHGEWTRQTVAHNTMAVDESCQLDCTGRLLVFEDTPQVKVMRGEAVAASGALLDRTVIVTEDAVLDLYRGRSSFRRTWDRTFRYQGHLTPFAQKPDDAKPLGQRDGYQHLHVQQRLPAGEPWKASWQTTIGQLNLTLAGSPGQQVILAAGPDKEEMVLARQEGDQASFASVLSMEAWRNPVQTARWVSTGDANTAAFEMEQKDGTATRVVIAHGPTPVTNAWQALGWRSDARVLCVRQKGPELTLLLAGGTFAQAGESEVCQPSSGNYLVERRDGKLEVVSKWMP